MRRVALSLALALEVSLTSAIPAGVARAGDRALIIGINDYPTFPRPDGRSGNLKAAVNDARAMAQLARELWRFPEGSIKVLINETATRTGILSAIEDWLISGTRPGDRVLLTYSGHGHYVIRPDLPNVESFRQTLAPHDTKSVAGRIDNMILDLEIKSLLDRLTDRDVMVIFDACYAGTVWRSVGRSRHSGERSNTRALPATTAPPTQFNRSRPADFDSSIGSERFLRRGQTHIAWSAVSGSELAEEDDTLPEHSRLGVFTRAMTEGLALRKADLNADGRIMPSELIEYVRQRANQYCAQRRCDSGRMTPQLEASSQWLMRDLLTWGHPAATVAAVPLATNLLPAGNHAEIKLSLLPGPAFRVGERMRIKLAAARGGWLIILNVRDDGHVVQLFPSQCLERSRRIEPGKTIKFPDELTGCVFQADAPGSGKIVAVLAEDNVVLEDLLGRHRSLSVVPDVPSYLSELAQRLLRVWSGDAEIRPTRWSVAVTDYRIEK